MEKYNIWPVLSFISVMFSRFTNIVECVRTSFFLLINIPFFPCILLKIYLIPSSTHGDWVFLLFLAVMNNAAMSIYTQAFVWIYVFISFEYTPRSGISGLCGTFMFNFLRDCWALSKAAVPLCIPASSVWGA